jgi:hypothetical protein
MSRRIYATAFPAPAGVVGRVLASSLWARFSTSRARSFAARNDATPASRSPFGTSAHGRSISEPCIPIFAFDLSALGRGYGVAQKFVASPLNLGVAYGTIAAPADQPRGALAVFGLGVGYRVIHGGISTNASTERRSGRFDRGQDRIRGRARALARPFTAGASAGGAKTPNRVKGMQPTMT